MIGIQTGMLGGSSFDEAAGVFRSLQARFPHLACEIHLEHNLYAAAVRPQDASARAKAAAMRSSAARLGVHLPFMDLNPVSPDPRIAEESGRVLEEALEFAGRIGAHYAVFHARGRGFEGAPRESEVAAWRDVVARLGERAAEHGLVFCLENADDLREMKDIRALMKAAGRLVTLCLDVGHLYERKPAAARLPRMAYALNDRLSPVPFLLKGGLPAAECGGWPKMMTELADRISCVHLHNHDGRAAHRRLRCGKIRLRSLRKLGGRLRDIPVILEADYSRSSLEDIAEDILYAEEILR